MRRPVRSRNLLPNEVAYLKTAVDSSDPRRVQKALQHLCKLDRQGAVVSAKDRRTFETILLGVLIKGTSDEPVRRWALNAIAAVGVEENSMQGVLGAIAQFKHEPQVVSAAIAAAFRLSSKAHSLISRLDLMDPRIVTLSALQTARTLVDLDTNFTINIEKDDELIQKLSLVNVGLGKAPSRLFDPKYSNAEIVKILSRDGAPMVSQYSVWAIAENDEFTAADLGIPPNRIDDQPVNVQAYIHGLYASKGDGGTLQHEIVGNGLQSEHIKVRLETAIGLRDVFHNGLDTLVVDCIVREQNDDVRHYLLDHIIRQYAESSAYKVLAIEMYEAEERDDALKERMRAAAAGLDIMSDFRQIDHELQSGLFSQIRIGTLVANSPTTTFNNNAPMQGVIAQQGDATNSGTVNSQIIQNAEKAKLALDRAADDVRNAPLDEEFRKAVLTSIDAAKDMPTKEKIGVAQEMLTKAKDMLGSVADASDHIVKLAGHAALLAPFLS